MPTPCTVSGNLQTLTANQIAQGKVIFQLTNIGTGNPIGVSGTSIIPALSYTVLSAPDGSFSIGIWGNDVLTPANTLYAVTFRDQQGNELGPILYSIVGASANMNTLVAASTVTPPVIVSGAVLLNPTALQTITGFPLAAPAFQSPNANPAGTGILRLANTDFIGWRNFANTNDVGFKISGAASGNIPQDTFVSSNGSGGLWMSFYSSANTLASVTGDFRLHSAGSVSWRNGANTNDVSIILTPASGNRPADTFVPNGGAGGWWASFYSEASLATAVAGHVRLSSTGVINWRNNANGADVSLAKNTNDSLTFGGFVQPQVVAVLNLTGQTAAIGLTTLYTVPASGSGFYRVSYSLILTTAGTGGTIFNNFTWNNGIATGTISGSSLSTTTTLGAEVTGYATNTGGVFYCAAGTVVTYQITFAGVTGSPVYTLRIRLEYLG